jgi:hypothetical protein
VLRVLQGIHDATTLHGESAVAVHVQPLFQGARRGATELWGTADDAQVILWDSLQENDKAWCEKDMASNTKWVILNLESQRKFRNSFFLSHFPSGHFPRATFQKKVLEPLSRTRHELNAMTLFLFFA